MRLKFLKNRIYGNKKLPLAKLLIFFCGTIIALNSLIIAYRATSSYYSTIENSKADAERLITTLSDHVELTFLAADLTLRRAVERQYFNSLFGNNLSEDTYNNFMVWVNETPQISGMLITDENGVIKLIYRKKGYETWFEGKESIGSMEIFYIHKESSRDSDMYFDVSKDKWISDRGLVMMSRKITKLNGTFGGIVLALVDNKYLAGFFQAIESGKRTQMSLIYESGPEKKQLINMMDGPETQYVTNLMAQAKTADTVAKTAVSVDKTNSDGKFRVYALKSIPNLHVVISTVMYGDDIFKEWRVARLHDILFLFLLSAFAGAIYFFANSMARQMARVENSEKTAVMASQAKSEFLANMSHELRTPLNAIIGFSEMMVAGYFGSLNDKQKDRINDVMLCGKHLLELINDILEFSKGEAGRLELRENEIEISNVVAEVTRIFAEKAKHENIKLQTAIADHIPKIKGDERKIKQILLNLISNSLKFSDPGGTITISSHIDAEGNFILAVSDTGIGIAQEDIPKALSVFGQVHKKATEGGTGLGLPLCKMFAELHGGYLKLESLEGVGTKVTIVLPKECIINSNQEELSLGIVSES